MPRVTKKPHTIEKLLAGWLEVLNSRVKNSGHLGLFLYKNTYIQLIYIPAYIHLYTTLTTYQLLFRCISTMESLLLLLFLKILQGKSYCWVLWCWLHLWVYQRSQSQHPRMKCPQRSWGLTQVCAKGDTYNFSVWPSPLVLFHSRREPRDRA